MTEHAVNTMDQKVEHIITSLQELAGESSVPRNVKNKIDEIIKVLTNEEEELAIRKDRALNFLDEISEDTNLQSYTRTQVWNIATCLEML